MQLMHMLYCLYCASCSGVCRYSPCETGFSSLGISQVLSSFNLCMKSSRLITRSRITGKLANGSTRIGVGLLFLREGAQLKFGPPLTIMPQLPHTPIRADQR